MAKNALETGGFTLPEPLYRLRLESGGQFPPAPAAEAPRRPAPASVAEVMDPAKAGVIDQKVEAERRSAGGAEDLLSPSAPLE